MRVWVRVFIVVIGIVLGAGHSDRAAADDKFNTGDLRGRYSGNVDISEAIPDGNGGAIHIEARALMALTFDGKSAVKGSVSVTAYIPAAGQTLFTCVFDAAGTYQLAATGLGTATLDVTPTTACAGPATFSMSLLLGGRNRSRLDVTIDGANSIPPGESSIPIVGSGSLIER